MRAICVWSPSACREASRCKLGRSRRSGFAFQQIAFRGGCWAFAEKVEDADLRHCIPVHSAAAQCIVKYRSASVSIPAAQCKTVMQVLPVHPSTKQFTPGWQQMDHSAQCICSATYQASLQCEKGRGALCMSQPVNHRETQSSKCKTDHSNNDFWQPLDLHLFSILRLDQSCSSDRQGS